MQMTTKKKSFLIILFSTIFALILGSTGSFYWIKNVYLKEKIEDNLNAVKLNEWYQKDAFHPPANNKISDEQIQAFINANQHLAYLLERMQKQFKESSWSIAFEVIKMQPEWQASKYVALQECHLSPMEYDWIAEQVVHFWVYRWKQESLLVLKEYGWSFDNLEHNEHTILVNYDILLKHEADLIKIFNILWPEHNPIKMFNRDSVVS
jgi:hypothetical protein